jgi:hypothetical protein
VSSSTRKTYPAFPFSRSGELRQCCMCRRYLRQAALLKCFSSTRTNWPRLSKPIALRHEAYRQASELNCAISRSNRGRRQCDRRERDASSLPFCFTAPRGGVISGVVISSGELKLTPSDLKAVFGRLGVKTASALRRSCRSPECGRGWPRQQRTNTVLNYTLIFLVRKYTRDPFESCYDDSLSRNYAGRIWRLQVRSTPR